MNILLAGLITLAAWAAAAPAPEFRIDPALVDSLSDAPAGLMRAEPYLIHFHRDDKHLYYVSAKHESREGSATFSVIRRAFDAFPIKSVIVEGRVNGKDDVSAQDALMIVREAQKGRYKAGEVDYAILLAHKKGILAIGGEPGERDMIREMDHEGFTTEDMLGLSFVNMIPSYRDQGRLAADGPTVLFAETMRWKRKEYGIPSDLAFDYASFTRWYEAKAGAVFDPMKIDYGTLRPDPKGTFLQRMSDAMTNIRNRFLAGVITRELRKHGQVLVVYGSGHHAALRRALVAAFGAPVYEGPVPDSQRSR